MGRASRILRRAGRAIRLVATVAAAGLGVGVLVVWGESFRRPVTAAFDARRGEQCRVVLDAGRAVVDNDPQVAADVIANAAARESRLLRAEADVKVAYKDAVAALSAVRDASVGIGSVTQPGGLDELIKARWATVAEFTRASKEEHLALAAIPAPPRPAWSLILPPYAPPIAAVLFAVPGALAIRRRLRARLRRRGGLCVACGYDCRATPGRCSECGAGMGSARGDHG